MGMIARITTKFVIPAAYGHYRQALSSTRLVAIPARPANYACIDCPADKEGGLSGKSIMAISVFEMKLVEKRSTTVMRMSKKILIELRVIETQYTKWKHSCRSMTNSATL